MAIMIDILTEKMENILGYYEMAAPSKNSKARCVRASYNKDTKTYWLQSAYVGGCEKNPKCFVRESAFRQNLKEYVNENSYSGNGYLKMVEPAICALTKVEDLEKRSMVNSAPTVVAPSTLTAVEGKTVVIRQRVLEIREGKFDNVPALDKNYYFTDLVNDDLQENKRILLSGHTGCGKTSMFQQIAARINQSFLRVNMNGQTTIGDLVGMWTARASEKGSETVWVDGVLPHAMKQGWWLVIDEIDCADPAILAVLNSVLEKDGTLTLKEKGHEIVVAHKDFRIVATGNTVGCMANNRSMYQGTNIMNEAFLDRFRVYHVGYLPAKEETALLMKKVPGISKKDADVMITVANGVREAFNQEQLSCTFSFRRLTDCELLKNQ
jgi:energy-coupling factor transporter ATP-binding protein EcfA2